MGSVNYLVPRGARAVTTSDSASQSYVGLYIGGAGNVAVTGEDGQDVTFTAVPVGTVLRLRVRKVKATGTTATNIVGFVA